MGDFLLDTNMLVGFFRDAKWARQAWEKFDLGSKGTIAFTSIVCVGEILALAEKWGWGENKRSFLDKTLTDIPTLDINSPGTIRAYALIDAWTQGCQVDSPDHAPPLKPAQRMSQNDLWIAATAHASEAILLSTDKDFAALDNIWFKFRYVDQAER